MNHLWLILCLFVAQYSAADDLHIQLQNSLGVDQQGSFTQRRQVQGLPIPLQSSGVFSYSEASGLHWETQKPVQNLLQVDQAGLRQQGNYVAGSDIMAQSLLGLFSGDMRELTRYFEVSVTGDIDAWQASLRPLNPQVEAIIRSLELRATADVRHLSIKDGNGDSTDIEMTIDVKKAP